MNAAELERAYGLAPGEIDRWVRDGIVPTGLTGARLEHGVIAAIAARPALSADSFSARQYIARRDEINAAWAGAVRAALARHPEVACPCAQSAAPAGTADASRAA